jgi:hypothetical protein
MTKLKIFVGSSLEASAEDKFVSPLLARVCDPCLALKKQKIKILFTLPKIPFRAGL